MSDVAAKEKTPEKATADPIVFSVAVFDGDGIGPEIMAPTIELLTTIANHFRSFDLRFETLPAGAAFYRDHGVALPKESLERARVAHAILLSAMGLPEIRYPDGTEIAPQIELRMALELFAGVRPVFVLPGQNSPLRASDKNAIDFVIVRESTEGLFASFGKGTVVNDSVARETLEITRPVSEKLFRFAFELARQRKESGQGKGLVHCVDKANVFQAFAFFRKIFHEIARDYPDVKADWTYVDAAALRMVQRPQAFDVMVTENMFGDILSDLGAGIMGSLGLAPSADIGERHAVFQPCHGSAPDIAGRGVANPAAMVLSAAMMLDWLGHTHGKAEPVAGANCLKQAVADVLAQGDVLTPDLGGAASTRQMADAIASALRSRLAST